VINDLIITAVRCIVYLVNRYRNGLRDEETGDWRKLHKEELHNLYASPSINRMIKSRRVRLVEHVAWIREKRNAYRIFVGKPEGKSK
jgi:hypothetical protein